MRLVMVWVQEDKRFYSHTHTHTTHTLAQATAGEGGAGHYWLSWGLGRGGALLLLASGVVVGGAGWGAEVEGQEALLQELAPSLRG